MAKTMEADTLKRLASAREKEILSFYEENRIQAPYLDQRASDVIPELKDQFNLIEEELGLSTLRDFGQVVAVELACLQKNQKNIPFEFKAIYKAIVNHNAFFYNYLNDIKNAKSGVRLNDIKNIVHKGNSKFSTTSNGQKKPINGPAENTILRSNTLTNKNPPAPLNGHAVEKEKTTSSTFAANGKTGAREETVPSSSANDQVVKKIETPPPAQEKTREKLETTVSSNDAAKKEIVTPSSANEEMGEELEVPSSTDDTVEEEIVIPFPANDIIEEEVQTPPLLDNANETDNDQLKGIDNMADKNINQNPNPPGGEPPAYFSMKLRRFKTDASQFTVDKITNGKGIETFAHIAELTLKDLQDITGTRSDNLNIFIKQMRTVGLILKDDSPEIKETQRKLGEEYFANKYKSEGKHRHDLSSNPVQGKEESTADQEREAALKKEHEEAVFKIIGLKIKAMENKADLCKVSIKEHVHSDKIKPNSMLDKIAEEEEKYQCYLVFQVALKSKEDWKNHGVDADALDKELQENFKIHLGLFQEAEKELLAQKKREKFNEKAAEASEQLKQKLGLDLD